MTLLERVLHSIADAGRELLNSRPEDRIRDRGSIGALCRDLLSQKGEALGTALAREVVWAYQRLDRDERRAFFRLLLEDFSPDPAGIDAAVTAFQDDPSPARALALSDAVEAPRQNLVRAINMAPGGTRAIVQMRADLLDETPNDPDLAPVDADFSHLLASWFNRGFLELRRIDWQTPASILEKLILYEAVHAIQGWDDLQRRLAPDRRCYAFFHPALADEPLIFVEVALVDGLTGSIRAVLDQPQPAGAEVAADTAIFYSISNCQRGLKGISFGNFLIKQVVSDLSAELPGLARFATLSPVPGFRRWLDRAAADGEVTRDGLPAKLIQGLSDPGWQADSAAAAALKGPLTALCAHYLVNERAGDAPRDPVARFHLGNGARLERINWLADVSPKGLSESAGIMVNYLYDLKRIEKQHEAYANRGTVAASRAVQTLARQGQQSLQVG